VTHSGTPNLLSQFSRSLPLKSKLHLFGHKLRVPHFSPILREVGTFCFLVLFALTAPAQAPSAKPHNQSAAAGGTSAMAIAERFVQPPGLLYQGVPAEIPQDQGTAGLRLEILRLGTTARLMQVVAHPDDEDGGLLTLQARGHGVSTLLMTLNRGEGGQNKIGSNLSDVLGVVRTEELLASDQHYGVQDRFSRVADFGFSKTAEETFEKWGGHDVALADIVRVIRAFRPDVLVARFSGTTRDGHGNHQASSILTKEAFHAAADPKRFPEQIAEGLEPWQPKKLYIGNVCPWGSMTCPDADWTVKYNTGQRNPELGMSYVQFAMEGLRHQKSQGAANWTVEDGDRFTFYRRVDSVLPPSDLKAHESDFFDGIDTSWQALGSRFDDAAAKIAGLRTQLTEIAHLVAQASSAAKGGDPSLCAKPLMQVVARWKHLSEQMAGSSLSPATKLDLLTRIAEKQQQAETALNLALGVTLSANASSVAGLGAGIPKEDDALTIISPGDEFMVGVTLHNGSKLSLTIDRIKLEVPAGWNTINGKTRPETIAPGKDLHADFRLRVPNDTSYTRPYWHRDDPNTESINHIDNENYATLPFPPPALQARVEYSVGSGADHARNGIAVPVVTPFLDGDGKQRSRTLAVVPAFSIMLEPGTQVISTHNGNTTTVTVGVTSNLTRAAQGELRLELPQAWRSEPAAASVSFTHRGEKREIQFKVFPGSLQLGRDTIRAVFHAGGQNYSEGYTLVTREDLGSFYYYQPARQRLSIVDVQVPHELKVGYIMGAGDDIPPVLKQVGMNVTMVPAEQLATEDLSKFDTIVLGIRAYDTQKDVADNNKKLLDFVQAGGTLVVQYNTGVQDFNNGHFTPYSADLSRARVSVEQAPVEILAPQDSIFHYPNTITPDDFNGWVQERGLYFMSKWDDHFTPLLACHDPAEDQQKGGLLRAPYGKGTYIYTGYAFFRQLPAGVPGAVRLFVNILSAHGPTVNESK
jgi:LmbE family N-acetylglucosaminyl deacetylase